MSTSVLFDRIRSRDPRRIVSRIVAAIAVIVLAAGCASSEETADNGAEDEASRRQEVRRTGPNLLVDSGEIRTVQIHGEGSETTFPVFQLGSGQKIRLSFDLMETAGRPLTVYFYHADREWNRDLVPAEYMDSFGRDDLTGYRTSRATTIPYIHYEYTYPNSSIDFRVSGNYIVRVTEQGMEDDVLFERPFFVAEQGVPVDMRLDNVLVAGRGYTSVQPFLSFRPPNADTNKFDYTVCFMRNRQFEGARCADGPSLSSQPELRYFLDPRDSFAPMIADYFLDLSEIRIGGRIERTDQTVVPWRVQVEPDYMRFPGTGIAPFLNGQTRVTDVVPTGSNPDVSAEYADVQFTFVMEGGRQARGGVRMIGSFNNWMKESAVEMAWNDIDGQYEATVQLKQGQYEYRYLTADPYVQEAMQGATPQRQSLYTSLVYFDDISAQTDRLIAVRGILIR
jgi:hypothetical protein